MPAPHEIVAAPLTVYLAPVDTAFPTIDDAPGSFDAAWEVLGTQGARNYDDDGVTVSHSEDVSDFVPVGSTMPTKRFRTSESYQISLNLVDISPTQYAKVMNDASVTQVAGGIGTPGEDFFSLYRGDQVNSFAILARGLSGIDNDLNFQYEFSKAFVSVNGDAQFKKGDPVMLPVEILAVRHSDSDVIGCRQQSREAS